MLHVAMAMQKTHTKGSHFPDEDDHHHEVHSSSDGACEEHIVRSHDHRLG